MDRTSVVLLKGGKMSATSVLLSLITIHNGSCSCDLEDYWALMSRGTLPLGHSYPTCHMVRVMVELVIYGLCRRHLMARSMKIHEFNDVLNARSHQ